MIRLLTTHDQDTVLDYLYQEPALNIFIIGDIENFGFEVDFQDIWAEFDQKNNYLSVLLRYKENILYYSHKEMFNPEWLPLINTINHEFISGRKSLTDLIYPHFSTYTKKEMYFCEVNSFNENLVVDETNIIDLKEIDDIALNFDVLKNIIEFDGMKHQEKDDYITTKLEVLKHSKTYFIKEDNCCASTVSTVADTKKAAMVVAVATNPLYRNKGYASQLMTKLLHEYLVNRHKSLCLFYDNPDAGKIYHRLGFVDKDMWVMLVRK